MKYTLCTKTDHKDLKNVAKLQHFGTTLTNHNCISEEMKSRMYPGNACYHSVRNVSSSCFVSRNVTTET